MRKAPSHREPPVAISRLKEQGDLQDFAPFPKLLWNQHISGLDFVLALAEDFFLEGGFLLVDVTLGWSLKNLLLHSGALGHQVVDGGL